MTFAVKPLTRAIGAEISDVDIAAGVDDATFRQIEEAFNRHSVILFRDQQLTPEQHVRFSRRFGELEVHVLQQYLEPGFPELLVISNVVDANGKAVGLADAGSVWHTDLSYMQKPSRAALLYSVEIPRDAMGQPLGDTLFSSTAAAYDALPADTRLRIDGLRAVHSYARTRKNRSAKRGPLTEQQKAIPDVLHPVVRTHPVTGRRGIFVNAGLTVEIDGLPETESTELLDRLFAHVIRPEFVYRHRWREGDLLCWDNYATQHIAMHDYALPQRRFMRRTTVLGDVPY